MLRKINILWVLLLISCSNIKLLNSKKVKTKREEKVVVEKIEQIDLKQKLTVKKSLLTQVNQS